MAAPANAATAVTTEVFIQPHRAEPELAGLWDQLIFDAPLLADDVGEREAM
jgi:hypothetical protein